MKPSHVALIGIAAVAGVLVLADTASAGEFSLRIGGLRFGSSPGYSRSTVIIDDGYRDHRYHHRRPRYHRRRSRVIVRDITPFRGHPPVYVIQPYRPHRRFVARRRPYVRRYDRCRR